MRSIFERSLRHGFTLMEMLVVVAIILLLLGLLLPVMGRSKEGTRRTICGTRLNQIGGAIVFYRMDWQRSFGLMEYNSTGSIIDVNDNMFALASRVPGLETFVCPSTKNYLSSSARLRVRPTSTTGDFSSYESYGHFDGGPNKTPTNCNGKESRIWLVYDMDNPDINHHLSAADPHGPEGGNVLHADTHVRWIRGEVWEATRFAAQRLHLNP